MKKLPWIICLAALLGSLCACGRTDAATTKSGTLTSAERFSIGITASDGTVYRYAVDDQTKMVGEAENLGDTLEVTSKGDYQEGIHAEEIKLVKAAEKPSATVGTVYGRITDASNASLTLITSEGDPYTLLKDDDTVTHSNNGILLDDDVEVLYTGSLDDGSAVARSILVTSDHNVQSKPAPQEVVKYATGECVGDTMHSILFQYGGATYSIQKTDATAVVGNITVGDTIRVFHKGDIADGMTAVKIVLVSKASANEAEDFEVKKLYGTVLDASNASVTAIETDGGKTVQIIKTDDTKRTAECVLGAYVEVTYKEMTEDGSVIALEIK